MLEALRALGFEWRPFLLNIIGFVILFLVLRRYLFRPLAATMRLRAQEISEGLDAAEKSKTALAHVEEEREHLLAEARDQGREHVRQAVREADVTRERLLAEAREEAQQIRTRGHQAVELEREQAMLEVRANVVDLALLAATKAVLQRMDERAHRQAVEQFITNLERSQ